MGNRRVLGCVSLTAVIAASACTGSADDAEPPEERPAATTDGVAGDEAATGDVDPAELWGEALDRLAEPDTVQYTLERVIGDPSGPHVVSTQQVVADRRADMAELIVTSREVPDGIEMEIATIYTPDETYLGGPVAPGEQIDSWTPMGADGGQVGYSEQRRADARSGAELWAIPMGLDAFEPAEVISDGADGIVLSGVLPALDVIGTLGASRALDDPTLLDVLDGHVSMTVSLSADGTFTGAEYNSSGHTIRVNESLAGMALQETLEHATMTLTIVAVDEPVTIETPPEESIIGG